MKKNRSPEQKEAHRLYQAEWRKANPDKAREHSKRTRERNKESINKRQKAWADKNPEKRRASARKYYEENKQTMRGTQLARDFGMTLETYGKMLLAQNGQCAICGGGPDCAGKSFAVDHCHKTGKVRALLCRGCNVGIGNLRDDPDLLIKAAEYLKLYQN